jgi:hypothetical protein
MLFYRGQIAPWNSGATFYGCNSRMVDMVIIYLFHSWSGVVGYSDELRNLCLLSPSENMWSIFNVLLRLNFRAEALRFFDLFW